MTPNGMCFTGGRRRCFPATDSFDERLVRPRRVGRLLVQGLAVLDAPSQELRPVRHDRKRIRLLG
jgi:hypothetical protein